MYVLATVMALVATDVIALETLREWLDAIGTALRTYANKESSMPSDPVQRPLGGSRSIQCALSKFVKQCKSVRIWQVTARR
jgi:hypothetical protein